MKWGVPLVALVVFFLPALLIAMWGTAVLGVWCLAAAALILIPVYVWMRLWTARDDQRLLQVFLALRLSAVSRYPGSFRARTYAPLRGRGARDVWR